MRESMGKYRGKRVDNGEWVYGSLTIYKYDDDHIEYGNTDVEIMGVHGDYNTVDPATVGQFTGRQDTKAIDVYEGDIWNRGQFTGVIKFKLGGWHIEPHPDSDVISYPDFNSNIDTGEVIGNIHDEASE